MGQLVYFLTGFLVGTLDQAKDKTLLFIDPKFMVFNPIGVLDFYIRHVRVTCILVGNPLHILVEIYKQWHVL